MKQTIISFAVFFLTIIASAQIKKEIYTDKVDDLRILVIELCADENGKVTYMKEVDSKSNFDDKEFVDKMIAVLSKQSMDYHGKKDCIEMKLILINPKFKDAVLSNEECKSLEFLKSGVFIYADPDLSETIINRDEKFQTENYKNSLLKAKIEWLSDCKYNLTYIEGGSGIVNVEIIGILKNQSIIYKATQGNLSSTGILIKKP